MGVGHLPPNPRQQLRMRNRVEVALQIRIHHVPIPGLQQRSHTPQRILTPAPRPKPVAVLRKLPLEDRFQHMAEGRLHHPVPYRGYAERPFPPSPRLGNPHPTHRLRAIRPGAQRLGQPLHLLLQVAPERRDRHVIYPCSAPVGGHFPIRRRQVRRRVDLVHQPEPLPSLHPLFEGGQHAVRPNRRFGPRPPRAYLSVGSSPRTIKPSRRHSDRCGVRRSGHRASTSLRPFAPPALPGFRATMDALTPVWPALRRHAPA